MASGREMMGEKEGKYEPMNIDAMLIVIFHLCSILSHLISTALIFKVQVRSVKLTCGISLFVFILPRASFLLRTLCTAAVLVFIIFASSDFLDTPHALFIIQMINHPSGQG